MRSSRSQWISRILLVAFGLLIAASYVGGAVSASDRLGVVGNSLAAIGGLGLFVSQAIAFRGWRQFFGPFRPVPEVAGGFSGSRRANRQINGKVPYEASEVPHLRRIAERRVSTARSVAGLAGSISLIVLCTGWALIAPQYGVVFGWVYRIFAVVLVLFLVVVLAKYGRTDPKAAAFLQRVQPVA